jgi:hypothetical protein
MVQLGEKNAASPWTRELGQRDLDETLQKIPLRGFVENAAIAQRCAIFA